MSEGLYSAMLNAKWHTLFVDVLDNDRGIWLQLAETRPNGYRQSIVLESEHWPQFERELLKAVSAVGARTEVAHSAGAVRARAYEEWSSEEDAVLRFLFKSGSGLAAIAAALQRERSAIRSRLRQLEVEVREG